MKALIAAGGKGSRLYPLTHTQNKHTIPLANTPLITLAVEKVVEAGITDIGISINEGDQEIYRIIGDGSRWGVNITYIEQTGGALGVAHVIGNAASFLNGDDFLFYLGDNIITNDLSLFVDKFYQEQLHCLLALTHVHNPHQFGVPVIEDNRIVRIDEKPTKPQSNYAVAGLYMYDKHMLEAVQGLTLSERGEYEISDAHTWLIQQNFSVGFHEITGWWKDTGKPEDLLEGNQLVLKEITGRITGEVSETARLQGNVVLEEGARLEGNTFVRGPVTIGKGAYIKDAYIGPFTSIGDNSYIEGAEVEHSIVMKESEIVTQERIVDSILGHNTVIRPYQHTFPRGHKLVVGDKSHVEV